jgi:hypothetical protein
MFFHNYRYFKRELLQKGGIQKRYMPKLFRGWIDTSLSGCMFTLAQQQGFSIQELEACPWYIECTRNFAPAPEKAEKEVAKAHPKSTTQAEPIDDEDESEEVAFLAPVKKGRKPRKKEIAKKTMKETALKDDTPSSSVPSSALAPPNPFMPPSIVKVIGTAHSHHPSTLMPVAASAFTSSEYIARSAIQPDSHGIESKTLILPSSISAMLNTKEKTGNNASSWDEMLDFSTKVM